MRAYVRACVCACVCVCVCVCKNEKDECVLVKDVEGGRCVWGGSWRRGWAGEIGWGECAARIFTIFSK